MKLNYSSLAPQRDDCENNDNVEKTTAQLC